MTSSSGFVLIALFLIALWWIELYPDLAADQLRHRLNRLRAALDLLPDADAAGLRGRIERACAGCRRITLWRLLLIRMWPIRDLPLASARADAPAEAAFRDCIVRHVLLGSLAGLILLVARRRAAGSVLEAAGLLSPGVLDLALETCLW